MLPPLSAELQAQIRDVFEGEDAKLVGELLLLYGEEEHEREVERVRRGVLSICDSKLRNVSTWSRWPRRTTENLIVAAPPER